MDNAIAQILAFFADIGSYAAALDAVLLALITLCLLIPGPQPEKFLTDASEFLKKFSKK